jgi:DegV family protein with EDD domain
MKKIGIITDSHSSITQQEAQKLGIKVLPMPFYIDETCYYEDVDITRDDFLNKLEQGANVSTSQPSPADVLQLWDEALEEYEQVLYIPISSGLSGSCMTAQGLAQDEPYEGRIFVVDNGRVSTLLHRSVLDALELVEEGYSAEEIKEILEKSRAEQVIYIGVTTLEYLKRGGRVNAATAAIGSVLNIKPVLKFDVGTLDMFQKSRGVAKMKKKMLEAMQHDFETVFKDKYDNNEVYLVAASSASKEETDKWVQEIKAAFPGMEVLCDELSLGVSCHIGPGGLGIGCSCRPERTRK